MVEDTPENHGPLEAGRPRREPPTIDLEATELPGETPHVADQPPPPPSPAAVSPWIISVISGAVAASLVIGVGWILGWPAVPSAPPPVSQVNAAAIDDLTTRIASVESKAGKSAAPMTDSAATARIEKLEQSLAAMRDALAADRTRLEKLAADLNDVRSAPRDTASPPDLTAINERLGQLERATRADSAQIAQQSAKIEEAKAEQAKAEDAKPLDDAPLRRVVTASLLDISVRHGDPYAAALAVAKSLGPNLDALKPLDGFAVSGVPNANALCRELLTLVPKLEPPAPDKSTTASGIVERLEAGASRLVRIQRTDLGGSDRGAIVARVTAAALRNDLPEARRELKTLNAADRAAAQSWMDKADQRDAALAASHQFVTEAMAALATPAQ